MIRVLTSGILTACVLAAWALPLSSSRPSAAPPITSASSPPSPIATGGSSRPSNRRTSRFATKASRSRSRCSTTHRSRSASSCCSTCRAAWRAICSCCARAPGNCSKRLRPDDGIRLGTFGHDVTISPTFTRDPRELRASLPRAIAPDAPTPFWRAIDEALNVFKNREEDDGAPVDPGVERRQGQRSDRISAEVRQPGRGDRSCARAQA